MEGAEPGKADARTRNGGSGGARRYFDVVRTLAARDFLGRYRGNLMGTLTALLVPVLFLATYGFVFTTLIPIRMRETDSLTDYSFFLFTGLIAWNLFAEPVARSPHTFTHSPHFVRTALFPASSLAASACVANFYQSMVWLAVFAAARAIIEGSIPATLALAPLALVMITVMSCGASLLIGALGVFFRDLADLVAPVLTLGMFVSPVLYSADRITKVAPWLIEWNPVAPSIVVVRALSQGTVPPAELAIRAIAWAGVVFLTGCAAYRRTRPVLGDVV